MATPPFNHWYVGVPPLTGVAVKVTDVPAQIAPAGLAAILTLAAPAALTTVAIEFDVAGLPVTQLSDEVILTEIWSALRSVVVVYVGPVWPAMATPPFNHWYVATPPLTGVAV